MFSVALALVISVVLPILKHVRTVGSNAYEKGNEVGTDIEDILR